MMYADDGAQPMAPLLEIENLRVTFDGEDGEVTAVNGVTLSVGQGETVALVGESGCGKSMTALSVLRRTSGRGFSI